MRHASIKTEKVTFSANLVLIETKLAQNVSLYIDHVDSRRTIICQPAHLLSYKCKGQTLATQNTNAFEIIEFFDKSSGALIVVPHLVNNLHKYHSSFVIDHDFFLNCMFKVWWIKLMRL